MDEKGLEALAKNMQQQRRIPDPTIGNRGGAPAGSTIAAPSVPYGIKVQHRMLVTCKAGRFFKTINRPVTLVDLKYDPVGENFWEQWTAIEDIKKEAQPDVPVVSKDLPMIRWIEAFLDHLTRCLGIRYIPLVSVVRDKVEVDPICPPREPDQPYSTEHGSILDDLIHRSSHNHGLFRQDNASVYYKIEEAVRGTQYADSIKPFQARKDGRGAFLALVAQYAGKDKWEAEIKKAIALLTTVKWKGTSNYLLSTHCARQRNANVTLQACANHVEYQLPNERTKVGFLLDSIESDDAGLNAALAHVRHDEGPHGMRENFEAAVAMLLPMCPVAKRKTAQEGSGSGGCGGVVEESVDRVPYLM